ncbi:MAG: hypothetical protein JSS29_19520 [Proteobacteria bacterium]|nr:hypothetical protein [Pseudomonadota bacterium]
MHIDIDRLTEPELIDLNHRVVARLKFLRQLHAHTTMLEFRIGERVRFYPKGRAPVEGMITRYNRKTVTVVTDAGQTWNVAPELLERAVVETSGMPQAGNVVVLHPEKGRR